MIFGKPLKQKTHMGNPSDSGGGNEKVCASNSGTFITRSDPSFGQDRYPTVIFAFRI